MTSNSKKSVKKFWKAFTDCTWEAFLNQNNKDEQKALESMRRFARIIIPENEHATLDQMHPDRLKALIPKLVAHVPNGVDLFVKHFESNKPTVDVRNLLGKLGSF